MKITVENKNKLKLSKIDTGTVFKLLHVKTAIFMKLMPASYGPMDRFPVVEMYPEHPKYAQVLFIDDCNVEILDAELIIK
jgi:hypothetical protein